jgi:hypothetical protein
VSARLSTPRPWTVRESALSRPDNSLYFIVGPDEKQRSAECWTRANAALIVHRVNTWEPLHEALLMVRDADDDCRRDGLSTIPKAARARIDAALKLAEFGETR